MRNKRLRSLILVAALAACSDPAGPGTDGPLMWSARLDGVPWTPQVGIVVAHVTSSGYLFVAAFRQDSVGGTQDAMGIQVANYAGPGHYALDTVAFDGNYGVYLPAPVGPGFLTSTAHPGEIWITEQDTASRRVAGVFHFRADAEVGSTSVDITSGLFRAVYDTVRP